MNMMMVRCYELDVYRQMILFMMVFCCVLSRVLVIIMGSRLVGRYMVVVVISSVQYCVRLLGLCMCMGDMQCGQIGVVVVLLGVFLCVSIVCVVVFDLGMCVSRLQCLYVIRLCVVVCSGWVCCVGCVEVDVVVLFMGGFCWGGLWYLCWWVC